MFPPLRIPVKYLCKKLRKGLKIYKMFIISLAKYGIMSLLYLFYGGIFNYGTQDEIFVLFQQGQNEERC